MKFTHIAQQEKYQTILQNLLDQAKKQGLTAEASLQADSGLSVTVRMGETETLEFTQSKGLSLTVYQGKRKGTVSTTDLSDEALETSLQAALRIAKYTEEDPFSGLADEKDLTKSIPDLDLYHPSEITPEQAIEIAKKTENAARNY